MPFSLCFLVGCSQKFTASPGFGSFSRDIITIKKKSPLHPSPMLTAETVPHFSQPPMSLQHKTKSPLSLTFEYHGEVIIHLTHELCDFTQKDQHLQEDFKMMVSQGLLKSNSHKIMFGVGLYDFTYMNCVQILSNK